MATVPTTADADVTPLAERPARLSASRRRLATALCAVVPIAAAAWVWRPIIRNFFYVDDFGNLFLICNAPLAEYLLTPHGGHAELFRNAVFYATARLFGTNASAYFTTVWLTHLVNVGLLFAAVRRFTDSNVIACLAAVLFGTCAAAAGSLEWYSVFGHVLVGTALLVILVDVAGVRRRGATPGTPRLWLWTLLALAGAVSFGVGVGIAMALPFALAFLLPATTRRRILPPLWPLLAAVPFVYAASYWAYNLIGRPWAFAKAPAVTTVIGPGILPVLRFTLELIAYAVDRLLAGPLPLPPYPQVGGTVVAAAFAALVLWCALRGRPARRQLLLAALLLTLGCYGTISAGRVFLIDIIGRSVAVAQLRYHYVGLITLSIAVAAVLASIADAMPPRGRRFVVPLLIGWAALWVIGLWQRPPVIDHHDSERADVGFLGAWFHSTARDTPRDQDVYIVNRNFKSVALLYPRIEFPGWAGLFSILFPTNLVEGRRVYFIEPDAAVRAAHRHSRRLAGVLIAPEDVPLRPGPWSPADPVCPLPSMLEATAP